MTQLSVNIDMVAALRELSGGGDPDPAQAAVLAEMAGADGITVQFRRDRRFVRERDLYLLKGIVRSRLNIEMPLVEDAMEKVAEIKPWMVTFFADQADAAAPIATIDFGGASVDFGDISDRFTAMGINVCYFVEPLVDQVKSAAKAGATAVLINCSGYTEARTLEDAQSEIDKIDSAVQAGSRANLGVYCGRGVTYQNIRPLAELGFITEFVVGRALCSRAMLVGFERAVSEMLTLIRTASSSN